MEIVVCVKQVPDVDDIKWTKENNLDREQMLSCINPHDEYALNYAVKIRRKIKGSNVTVISMGPNKASEILSYAIAKGADRAILLSDKRFSGSDTLITAKILSKAIKKYIGNFDVIITGQAASDGDTEQTPIGIATELDIADITNVIEITNADNKLAIVKQKLNNEINLVEAETPCLIAVKEECDETFTPKIEDYVRSQMIKPEIYNADDLEFNKEETGILGSPTMVFKAFRPENKKIAELIEENKAKTLINKIIEAKQ